MTARILLLAGTAEARELAAALAAIDGIDLIASLAGVTTAPAALAGRVRTGGFGAAAGLADYLRAERVTALINATHPFAAQMTIHAVEAAAAVGLPYLRLMRPPWEGARQNVPDIEAAARALPPGANAFITTGRKELDPFARRTDITGLVRFIEPVAGLPPHLSQIVARPPFPLAAETAMMQDHGITHLVTKNAGGVARAKLDAAYELGLPVIMVTRPPQPAGPVAESVEEAVAWVHAALASGP